MTNLDRVREMPSRQLAGYLVFPVTKTEWNSDYEDEVTFTVYTSEFISESYGTYKRAYAAVVDYLDSQY